MATALKTGIIVGSPRAKSQSSRIAHYMAARLKALGHDSYILDLRNNPLPLWNEEHYKDDSPLGQLWQPYGEEIAKCTGYIVISPEWDGMATPHIKNFFLYCHKGELAHKPGLITSVTAGGSGPYPIADLKAFSAKNVHLVYIPDHLIVRWTSQLALDGTEGHPSEPAMLKRIDHGLKALIEYQKALIHVRESGCVDLATYPYGM